MLLSVDTASADPGEPQAVLLVDHTGPAASPDVLPAGSEAGGCGIAVLNAR